MSTFSVEPVSPMSRLTRLIRTHSDGRKELVCQHVGDHADCIERAKAYQPPQHLVSDWMPQVRIPDELKETTMRRWFSDNETIW